MISAMVPGSFDPPTNGHLDVIGRCAGLFDRVIVSVVGNPSKTPLFTAEERVEMLGKCCSKWANVEVEAFTGLLVEFASLRKADVIVKGLRAMTDFDYELQMSQMNRQLDGTLTLFIATKPEYGYLSSSLVKEVARFQASVDGLVPDVVAEALRVRYAS